MQTLQSPEANTILNAVRQLAALNGTTAMEILNGIGEINKKLEKRIAFWKTQDAIQAYLEHVAMRHAVPRNHTYWAGKFEAHFKDKNIAEIPPAEIEGFLFANWGECERSTWNKIKMNVSGFYSFAIRELKRKGSPSFHNPCGLIDDQRHIKRKKHEFVAIDKMKALLNSFKQPNHWLWFHILVTAGLRISELTELRPMDVSGRILTLGGGAPCKSGRPFGEEEAVIPQAVADKLSAYMVRMGAEERIFKTSHANISALLDRRCVNLNMDHMSPHDLRRWIATYYYGQKEIAAVRFVLRHSSLEDGKGNIILDALTGKYVMPLTPAAMIEVQDETLAVELFENTSPHHPYPTANMALASEFELASP